MNKVRGITYALYRTYSRRSRVKDGLSGIRGRVKMQNNTEDVHDENLTEIDAEDLAQFESDFMNVEKYHVMHERETAAGKELQKNRIVAEKYFKEVEPSFLTFIEKMQIQELHQQDPTEWTIEKLSESFPALPMTIKRVLKSKWVPKTVDTVVKYDEHVIQNWKDFRTNKLAVSHALREHLMKFKGRKITPTDRHLIAERLIPPKTEIPKPKSKAFTSIVQMSVDQEKSDTADQKLIASTYERNVNHNETSLMAQAAKMPKKDHPCNKHKGRALIFNEFVKEKLEEIYKTSPEEGIVLLDMYRKQVEAENREDSNVTLLATSSSKADKNVPSAKAPTESSVANTGTNKEPNEVVEAQIDNAVGTYIKEWNKKADTKFAYIMRVKIPKNVYKPGMTYRIKDCYYDDDGEFLYRTPGLRS